jgi:D-alanyl-D-alanine carboxypeptidase
MTTLGKSRTKQVLGTLVTAATVALVVAPSAAAPPDRPDDPGLQARLDHVVAAGSVGALAMVRDGRDGWRGNSGIAELGTTRDVPIHGRFRIGSITKTFVATVVLQLVHEGRLRLDDPVDRWLPGVVPHGDRITVRHLLNHTSGLYDFRLSIPLPPSQEFLDNRWRTWTAAEQIERAVAHPPTSEPPGEVFGYSNTNYLVLGEIIEKATGNSYGTELERRIIRPLRLHNTTAPGSSPRIRGPHPHGYAPVEDGDGLRLVDFTEMNPTLFGASGELISTARDLQRFFAALFDGELLPDHLLEEMQTPGDPSRNYGLGLAWRDLSCGIRVYGNDGDALSYQSWSFATDDTRRQVTVVLTPDFSGDPDDAVDAFLDEAFCG